MAWIYLLLAGACEVVWAVCSKYAAGFTAFWPSFWMIVFNIVSVALLVLAQRQIALGTAYAVWTGFGAVGTAILGIVLFAEPATLGRLLCIGLIVLGILGLKFFTPVSG